MREKYGVTSVPTEKDISTMIEMGQLSGSRWKLAWHLGVFHFKLWVDSIRDFIMMLVSFVAVFCDLLTKDPNRRTKFYRLLRAGKGSDKWINLFGAVGKDSADDT